MSDDRPDVSPDDLTARLREMAPDRRITSPEAATLRRAADRIDALSGDVARLTAQLDLCSDEMDSLNCALVDAWAERDEALALVAERDATIERLRETLRWVIDEANPVSSYTKDDLAGIARVVLADTAPTPETSPQDPTEEP